MGATSLSSSCGGYNAWAKTEADRLRIPAVINTAIFLGLIEFSSLIHGNKKMWEAHRTRELPTLFKSRCVTFSRVHWKSKKRAQRSWWHWRPHSSSHAFCASSRPERSSCCCQSWECWVSGRRRTERQPERFLTSKW